MACENLQGMGGLIHYLVEKKMARTKLESVGVKKLSGCQDV